MKLRNIVLGAGLYTALMTSATCCGGTQEKTYASKTEPTQKKPEPQTPNMESILKTPEGREKWKGKYKIKIGKSIDGTYEVKKNECVLEYVLNESLVTTITDESCDNNADYGMSGILIDGNYHPWGRGRRRIEGENQKHNILLKEAQKSVKPENKITEVN